MLIIIIILKKIHEVENAKIEGFFYTKAKPSLWRTFIENKNGAGEDLYLSGATRRRTTTGEDELGPGSEQSDGLRNRRSRGGEGEKIDSRMQRSRNKKREKSPRYNRSNCRRWECRLLN